MKQYTFDNKEHLHKLDGVALTGTSSITKILSKPLSYWASGKACEVLGWLNPKKFNQLDRDKKAKEIHDEIKKMPLEDYVKILDTAYHAHAKSLKESVGKGTDLHEILERFIKSEMGISKDKVEYSDFDLIYPFVKWSKENVKRFLWSEAHCYSEKYWIGGISDFGCELNDGNYAVGDFKSHKEAYPSDFLQGSLYAIQINENGLFSENGKANKKLDKEVMKLIIVPFGSENVVPEIREHSDWIEGAKSAITLYRCLGYEDKIKNN